MKMIEIPQARFGQGDDVWALFRGELYPGRVVKRFYDPECQGWYYKLGQAEMLFVEADLGPRELEPLDFRDPEDDELPPTHKLNRHEME